MEHDRGQPFSVRLGQDPGSHGVDIFIQFSHELPDGYEGLMKPQLLHEGLVGFYKFKGIPFQAFILFTCRPWAGDLSFKVFANHGQTSADQISQVIGQIGVDSCHQGLFAELGVKAKDHVTQQKIPEGVQAIYVGQLKGLYHIP